MNQECSSRYNSIRMLLHAHVTKRLNRALEKWEGKSDSLAKQEINKAREKYVLETILEKGASCSSSIAIATHVAKATHPDMKVKNVSNLNVRFSDLHQIDDIGSHLISDDTSVADTTGDGAYNSAAYELYLLLDIRFEGTTLGALLQQQDKDVINAFSPKVDDELVAKDLARKYAALLDEKVAGLSSHVLAKQVYWNLGGDPTDDANYHLLQPMFSSSLAHVVHADINEVRFGETNKQARQAFRSKSIHNTPYRDYHGLVIRKLGGTKPQNISQLNSERGGVNYLLSSLPPNWTQTRERNFLSIESTLGDFTYFEGVKELLNNLVTFLKTNPEPTMQTRNKREAIERALGEALLAFGLFTQQRLPAGWTRDSNCQLHLSEQLWLDPNRTELAIRPDYKDEDTAFNQAYSWNDWPDQVAHRFGNWLNAFLRQKGLPVSDTEHAHWVKQAIIDCQWPAPMRRHAIGANLQAEVSYG